MNLTFVINDNGPAYKQIAEYIIKEIKNGNLRQDEKLPSKRRLADSLNVSINTILHAYIVLLDAQYIYSIEKKGYFVNAVKQSPISYNEKVNEITTKIKYDFTTKKIDEDLFPKTTWKRLYKAVFSNKPFLDISPSTGLIDLKLAISIHLRQNRGISVLPEQIIIGSGIEYLLSLLVPLLNIDTFGIENPGYTKITSILKNTNKNIKYLSIDDEGVIPRNDIDAIYATPFNQFPLGIKMTLNRKKQILSFLEQNNKYLIEDDFDADFRFNTSPSTALFSLNPNKVIFLSSFSRTISSSLRISYMLLPKDLLLKYTEKYSTYSTTVPTVEQYVLASFINEGHYQIHINKLRRIYKQRRQIIYNYFSNKDDFVIQNKSNYLYLLVKTKKHFKKSEIIDIDKLSKYDKFKNNDDVLLIGYSNIKKKDIVPGLEALCSCFE